MAYTYSLGVIFNRKVQAEEFKAEFEKQKFKLKDSTEVGISIFLNDTVYCNSDCQHYAVTCFVNELRYPHGNSKFFELENFNWIRDLIYDFLINYKGNFSYAYYELEGADKILTEDTKIELKA